MPNIITIFRLFLIPILLFLIFSTAPKHKVYALGIFILAALTDWLDGYVARVTNQITDFGRVADPLVDRIFIATTLISLFLVRGIPPLWALAVIIGRDLTLIVGYKLLEARRKIRIPVTDLGKLTTACLMIALSLLILNLNLGIWIFYLGLSLSIISGLDYIKKGVRRLKEGTRDLDFGL